jgi:hypothetical protein
LIMLFLLLITLQPFQKWQLRIGLNR